MMGISKKFNPNRIRIPTSILVVSVFVISTILLVSAPFMKYNNNYHNYYSSSILLFATNAYAQYDEEGGGGYDGGGYDGGAPDYGPTEPPDYGPPDNAPDYNVPEPPESAPAPEPEPPAPVESPPPPLEEAPPANTVEAPPTSSQPSTPSETQAPLVQTPSPLVESPPPSSTNQIETNPINNNPATIGPDTVITNTPPSTESANNPDGMLNSNTAPTMTFPPMDIEAKAPSDSSASPSQSSTSLPDAVSSGDQKNPFDASAEGGQCTDYLSAQECAGAETITVYGEDPNAVAGGGVCGGAGQNMECTTAAQDMNLMKEAAANNPFPNSPPEANPCDPSKSSCANGDYLPDANNRIPDSATQEQVVQAIAAEKAFEFNTANHDDIDGMINVGKSFSQLFRDYALVAGPEAVFADLPAAAAAGKAADTAVTDTAAADTAVTDTAAAGKAAGTTSQVFSPLEQTVAQEAQGILESKELDTLRAAYESGKPTEVVIDGRTIVYAPEYSGSGMTLFGEDGFVLGNHAFSSEEELTKTLLHELHRLNTSASSIEGVSGELAGSETAAAQKFADDIYAKGKSGGLW